MIGKRRNMEDMEMKNGKTRVWYVKDECLGRGERLMSVTPT